jgi:hypothetical protein
MVAAPSRARGMEERSMKRVLGLLAVCVLLSTALAVSAAAKPLVKENYSDSFGFDEVICGVDLHGEVPFSGVFMLKEGRPGDPTPYFFDNYRWQLIWTDPEDDSRGFIESGKGMWKDLHIRLIEGTVYEFTIHEVGVPYQIKTLDGRSVHRDRGRITWTFIVDTQGDSDLENDVFLTVPTPASVAGPHPLLEMDGDTWCTTVLSLLD